mmetsp:Transcript_14498/g.59150  ORF Transcript_14498/g.59150 Transcript_14498/m.59150 type:complete len:216 (+) Transcript_14498:1820-2467(+)
MARFLPEGMDSSLCKALAPPFRMLPPRWWSSLRPPPGPLPETLEPRSRCVIITTSGMLHSSRIARTSPMDSGSSMCASSTKRRKPGMDGCAGAAWVDRPNRSRCSISASALHARLTLSSEMRSEASESFRLSTLAVKRLLWSLRCTPLRCLVKATDALSLPAMTGYAPTPISGGSTALSEESSRDNRPVDFISFRAPPVESCRLATELDGAASID